MKEHLNPALTLRLQRFKIILNLIIKYIIQKERSIAKKSKGKKIDWQHKLEYLKWQKNGNGEAWGRSRGEGVVVLPMPWGLTFLEMGGGGGLPGEGGRQRCTPTLHSKSSSIFLLGPFMLTHKHTHRAAANKLDVHTRHKEERRREMKGREKART